MKFFTKFISQNNCTLEFFSMECSAIISVQYNMVSLSYSHRCYGRVESWVVSHVCIAMSCVTSLLVKLCTVGKFWKFNYSIKP